MDEFTAGREMIRPSEDSNKCLHYIGGSITGTGTLYYSWDKLEILTRIPYKLLLNFLEMEELRKECRKLWILPASKKAKLKGYKSKIAATVPSKRFFELLNTYDLLEYKITYIEIAKDEQKLSENEAKFESYNLLMFLVKKYTSDTILYDVRDSCHPTNLAYQKGLTSEMTGYWNSKYFRFALYARLSKINGEPCIHSEWRIRGAGNIKKRTGIETIEDCIDLDLKKYYEENFERYITFEEINTERLGKWYWGWTRKRKFSKRQKISINLASITFLNVYEILTAAQLAYWFKKEKARINSKMGPRTAWDRKILSVRSNAMFSEAIII